MKNRIIAAISRGLTEKLALKLKRITSPEMNASKKNIKINFSKPISSFPQNKVSN